MIVNIEVSKIIPHPENPRKNLGDLTELAESIKANGIFQNLTVIPADKQDTYTVIIGHRRLAAAKQAGLETVPCAVTEMDRKTQLSTMLLENMQRADLSFYEQAQGFQMMFDLGVSVKEIAAQTGFGESTVRKRLTISKLPEKEMIEAESRGAKLEDYIKVCEIEDETQRNILLKCVGTHNFDNAHYHAVKKQEKEKKLPAIKEELKKFAVKGKDSDRYSSKYITVLSCSFSDYEPGKLTPKSIKKDVKYRWVEDFNGIAVMIPDERKPKEIKLTPKEIAANKHRDKLKEITNTAYELRRNFISEFSASKKYENVLNKYLFDAVVKHTTNDYKYTQSDICWIREKIGQKDSAYYLLKELLHKYGEEHPENYKALVIYKYLHDSKELGYFIGNYGKNMPTHEPNSYLDFIYSFLCELGYQMSDDEKALQDGSHEIFKRMTEEKKQ